MSAASSGRSPLRALVITTFCVYFGFGLVSPVIPLFASDLGAGAALVGLTVAGFGVASFCFDLVGGRIGERAGAARAAAGGAALVAVASLAGAAANGVPLLLLSRFLTGAGSAIYVTTAMNIIARTSPPERMGRSMGTYQGAILSATAIGPAIGGLVAGWAGLRLPFLLYALVAAGSALAALVLLPQRLPPAPPRLGGEAQSGGFGRVLRAEPFLIGLATAFVVFILRQGVNSTAVPVYAHEGLGLSHGQVGLALSISALANFLFLPHAGRLVDRRPRGVAIQVGLIATLAALALFGGWQQTAALYGGMFVLGFATAYAGVAPAALITDVTPPARSSTAMGVYRMAVDAGSVSGPLAAGVLTAGLGYRGSFLAMAAPAALLMLWTARLRDTRRSVAAQVETPAGR